jgi:hypothetical protein
LRADARHATLAAAVPRHWIVLLASLGLSLGTGCRCGESKPYTPFGVASSSTPSASPPGSVVEEPDAAAPPPAFAGKTATKAPPAAARWQLGPLSLTAPAGRAFERGLAADFDADGKEEAVTWTVPVAAPGTAEAGAPGELWLHPSSGEPKRLVALPGFVPSGASCRHEPSLAQTGPKSVTLDVAAHCEPPLLARTPKRAVVIVAPLAERPALLTLRLADAAPGETLKVDVDSTDRDGDGRDDIRFRLTVAAEGSQRAATAELTWFERALGVARDAIEPTGSLGRSASLALARSKNKQTAESASEIVANTRRLMSSVCAEGGVPRLFDADGSPFTCGRLGIAVDRLALAEVRAAMVRGDPLAAVGAISRDGWYFGKAAEPIAKEMHKLVEAASQRIEAAAPIKLEARPTASPDAPRFSPLAFEDSGALLIQTSANVVRVSSDGSEQLISEGGPALWPLEVRSAEDARFSGVVHACDRNELLLSITAPPGAAPASPFVSSLLAARPGTCRGGAAPKLSAPAPLAWKPDGIEALVAGAQIGPKTSPAEAAMRPQSPGTPRSPDGRLLVAPSALGLLVVGTKKPELWRHAALPDWTALSDCTVANDARAIACVSAGRVLLLRRP